MCSAAFTSDDWATSSASSRWPHSCHRVSREHGLQPHRTRGFKYSTDPELEAKVTDVIGLYLHPPEKALVLCGTPA